MTLKESVNGGSEQNLVIIDSGWKAPGVGGTWTAVSQSALATYDHSTDATNDAFVFSVKSDELSDGFNCVELSMGSGTVMAVLYDLHVKRYPANLASNVV
jgi:hypothetical protein